MAPWPLTTFALKRDRQIRVESPVDGSIRRRQADDIQRHQIARLKLFEETKPRSLRQFMGRGFPFPENTSQRIGQ